MYHIYNIDKVWPPKNNYYKIKHMLSSNLNWLQCKLANWLQCKLAKVKMHMYIFQHQCLLNICLYGYLLNTIKQYLRNSLTTLLSTIATLYFCGKMQLFFYQVGGKIMFFLMQQWYSIYFSSYTLPNKFIDFDS